MNKSVALSIFFGSVVIAVAIYLGLTKANTPILQSNTEKPTIEPSTSPIPSPTPEITWTKSDIIAALSTKTGIPASEIVFSTGDTVDHGNTKLIRGTVQRQGEMSGAGFFAVIDVNGVNVTYVGQGVPNCTEVNPYGYPISWADYCMNGGNTVKR